MKKLICAMTLLLSLVSHSLAATHYFVRHAEKDLSNPANRNPNLSLLGQQRAQNLALMLSKANIKHIHSTAYKRTEQTAAPLAQSLNITISHYDPRNMAPFIAQLKTTDENSLIVGHSNTTTEAVSLLTGQAMDGLSEKDYGDVFQVVIEGESMTINHLKLLPAPVNKAQPNNTK